VLHALRQKGMVALMVTMIVLAIVTVVTLFTARVIVIDQKTYKNIYDRAAAQNAAQAGFDYAYGYLASNVTAVTVTGLTSCASATNTYTLSAGTNSPLPNGATFSMRYGCVATNTDTISLSATGVNSDGTSTNTVSALLKRVPDYAVIARSTDVGSTFSVDMANSMDVINNTAQAKTSINAGGTVRLRNRGSATVTTLGSPYTCAGNKTLNNGSPPAPTTCQDIVHDNTNLSSMSTSDFETNFIGRSISSFSSLATVYNIDCSSGNKTFTPGDTFASQGCTGTGSSAVFVNATASIAGAIIYINMGNRNLTITTIKPDPVFSLGTAVAPVILVINTTGNVDIVSGSKGTVTIYGNIYTNSTAFIRLDRGGSSASTVLNGIFFSSGPLEVSGGTFVNGVVVGGQVDMQTNNTTITYTPGNIINTYGGYYGSMLGPRYSVVSGSWKDF